jgi:hypothetical protein
MIGYHRLPLVLYRPRKERN